MNDHYRIITRENFKDEYRKCKTFGDWDRLFECLTIPLIKELVESHQSVKDLTGLTMRESSFLANLKGFIKGRGINI